MAKRNYGRSIFTLDKVEQNLDLKTSRKKNIKSLKKMFIDELVDYEEKNNLSKQKVTKEELDKIKEKIRKKLKLQKLKSFIYTVVTIFLMAILVFYLLR